MSLSLKTCILILVLSFSLPVQQKSRLSLKLIMTPPCKGCILSLCFLQNLKLSTLLRLSLQSMPFFQQELINCLIPLPTPGHGSHFPNGSTIHLVAHGKVLRHPCSFSFTAIQSVSKNCWLHIYCELSLITSYHFTALSL